MSAAALAAVALLDLGVAALLGWRLVGAVRHGAVALRREIVRRGEQPFTFWLIVLVVSFAFLTGLSLGALLLVSAVAEMAGRV